MSDRCIWSNRKDPGVRRIDISLTWQAGAIDVCPEHEKRAVAAIANCTRYGPLFVILLFGSVIGVAVGTAIGMDLVLGGSLVALGATVVAFPFVTPQTVALLGLRRGAQVGRLLGGVVVAVGILETVGLL